MGHQSAIGFLMTIVLLSGATHPQHILVPDLRNSAFPGV